MQHFQLKYYVKLKIRLPLNNQNQSQLSRNEKIEAQLSAPDPVTQALSLLSLRTTLISLACCVFNEGWKE